MNEACPFCGANAQTGAGDRIAFQCGAFYTGSTSSPTLISPGRCYERQIAALQARLEAAEALLELWREALKDEDIRIVNPAGDVIEKLQAAGEIE